MKFLKALLFCLCTAACSAQTTSSATLPVDLHDGIKTGSLAAAGINPDSINLLTEKINSGYYPNIHSLLVYKNGRLVYENYFEGKDEKWGIPTGLITHRIDDLHDMRSVTKSIVSALTGIALQQGKIKSIDQKVFDFFKEYRGLDTGQKQAITIRHLLTMTCGLKWNEDVPYNNPENSEIQMTLSKDPVGFILGQPLVSTPGAKWNYNGGAVQLLAAIIEQVSGKTLQEYANENLFAPLGIKSFYWYKFPGSKLAAAASGLRLRSRDALKFGILYQQHGAWEGRQLIDKRWVKQSMNKSATISPNLAYGYFFWKVYPPAAFRLLNQLTVAVGNGDQRIFIDEQQKLIVVVTAGNYNSATIFGKHNALAMLSDCLYPSFIK